MKHLFVFLVRGNRKQQKLSSAFCRQRKRCSSRGEGPEAALVVAAVQKNTRKDFFHAARPAGGTNSLFDILFRNSENARCFRGNHRIDRLVCSRERNMEGKSSRIFGHTGKPKTLSRNRKALCHGRIHRIRPAVLFLCRPDKYRRGLGIRIVIDKRHAFLDDARLLARNGSDRISQVLHVVQADGRDGADRRLLQAVGGILPPAQSGLQDNIVRRVLSAHHGKHQKQIFKVGGNGHPGTGKDLFCLMDCRESIHESGLGDHLPVKAEPLSYRYQMGRGKCGRRLPGAPQYGGQKGADRPLAVGAGHMDHLVFCKFRIQHPEHRPEI